MPSTKQAASVQADVSLLDLTSRTTRQPIVTEVGTRSSDATISADVFYSSWVSVDFFRLNIRLVHIRKGYR